jgi:signal transduction histidine kinase
LFFDKAPQASLPDLKVLEQIIQLADVGVLVVNSADEVLYINNFNQKIAAHFHLKNKLTNLLKYSFAEGGSGNVSLSNPESKSVISVFSSIVNWNGEKAAVFLLKDESRLLSTSSKSDFYLASMLVENIKTPVLLFENDLLAAANLSAVQTLEIHSDEYHKTHLLQLFDQNVGAGTAKTESIFEVVKLNGKPRGMKHACDILCSNLLLDGKQHLLVQILPLNHEKKISDSSDKNLSAHEVITMASHDLREPVRTISNFSQLTVQKLKQGKYKQAFEYAQLTNSAAMHMDKLLSDLKVLISLDEFELEKTKLSAEAVVQEAIADVSKTYDAKHYEIRVHRLPELYGNQRMLVLLFKNLLDNAIKFRKNEKAEIEVVGEKEKDNVVFCVRDNGIGIARKYHRLIFEPFQRLNRVDEYPGSGLGLTIAKKIVEKHQGTIYVDSMANAGASVYISLPA